MATFGNSSSSTSESMTVNTPSCTTVAYSGGDSLIFTTTQKNLGSSAESCGHHHGEDARALGQSHFAALTSAGQIIQSNSLFPYAHSFSINNPIFAEKIQTNKHESRAPFVLSWLAMNTMSGVEYNSSARDPPPRCHEGTRLRCLTVVETWLQDPHSKWKLLWLCGPAGVGKSAISQTLAERFEAIGRLGATIFFPKPLSGQRHIPIFTPWSVWPTIAYRLATQEPSYLAYLVEHIDKDPKLVEQSLAHQFDVFIAEPFGRRGVPIKSPLLPVIMDGLESCFDQETQAQIIRLIVDFIQRYTSSPLIWLVTSRSEGRFEHLFQQYDHLTDLIWRIDVPVESPDARSDVQLFMKARFCDIARVYDTIEPLPWPTEVDFNFLIRMVCGLFILASAIIGYVGNPDIADPMAQLDFALSVLKGQQPASPPSLISPFRPVHDMYTQVLQGVPEQSYAVVKRILGFYLLPCGFGVWPRDSTSFWSLCNILGIKKNSAYASLSKLHSVLSIPKQEAAINLPLRFLHASFSDFLQDRDASGDFWIDVEEVLMDLWRCHFRILDEVNDPAQSSPELIEIQLAWLSPASREAVELFRVRAWESARLILFHHLIPCPRTECPFGIHISALSSVHCRDTVTDVFQKVDFGNLVDGYASTQAPYSFIRFLDWLLEKPSFLREKRLLQDLVFSADNFNWIRSDIPSFVIHSRRDVDGGCVTTFGTYTDQRLMIPDGVEKAQLFSTQEEPKPFSHLVHCLSMLLLHKEITTAVIVGLAEVGQCALVVDRSSETDTVYYILPYEPVQ